MANDMTIWFLINWWNWKDVATATGTPRHCASTNDKALTKQITHIWTRRWWVAMRWGRSWGYADGHRPGKRTTEMLGRHSRWKPYHNWLIKCPRAVIPGTLLSSFLHYASVNLHFARQNEMQKKKKEEKKHFCWKFNGHGTELANAVREHLGDRQPGAGERQGEERARVGRRERERTKPKENGNCPLSAFINL